MTAFFGARAALMRQTYGLPNAILPTPILLDNFESLATNTGSVGNSTSALSSTFKVQGTNALRMVSTGFGGTQGITRTGVITTATNPANLGTIAFYLNNETPYYTFGGATPGFVRSALTYAAPQEVIFQASPYAGRWVARHISEFTNAGTAISTLGSGTAADFKYSSQISSPFYEQQNIDLLMSNAGGRPTVVLTCDDGYVSQYNILLPLLQKYRLVASFAPTKNNTGNASNLTLAMMNTMYAAGNDFICDGRDDDASVGSAASLSAMMTNLNSVRAWTIANGFPRGANHIVWPFGIFEVSTRINTTITTTTSSAQVTVGTSVGIVVGMVCQTAPAAGANGLTVVSVDDATHVTLSAIPSAASPSYYARFTFTDDTNAPFYGSKILDACKAAGFLTGRTVSQSATSNDVYSRYGLGDQALCYPSTSITYTSTASALLAQVDTAILRGTTLPFYWHDQAATSSSSTPNTVPTAVIDGFLSGLADRVAAGTLDVLTVAQWHTRDMLHPASLPF